MADIRVKILVFKHDGTVVSQYLLGEGVHAIGRDPNSAIYAESEYISNEHANLHLSDEGIFIEDLNSTSGTFLDNVTVRGKVRLNPGQRLQIGDLYIDLQLEGAGDLSPGAKIGAGRYQLVKELGRGAMGQVWLGQDTQLDEQVAIKVLGSDVANDAVSLLDLKREVQKSRKLSQDNIIRIHDLVQLPGENPFITLEYVEGTDLHVILLNQPDHIFQWPDLKAYVLQLCEALDYAHERKIVHRDLKPSNIMITQNGVLKLADFGIAASIADATGRSSMANVASGTPQFMSPQQMLGESPKASDDIYAFGSTIYNLLTGRPPFHTGDIVQQVHHITPTPIEQRMAEFGLQNSVPDYVNSVVLSCLAKDPEARPTSAGAIAEWIRTEGKSDIPVKPKKTETYVGEVMTAEPPAKDKKTPVLAIAAVVVIAVVLGVLFLGKSGKEDENQNQSNVSQAGGKEGTERQSASSAQTQAKLKEGLVAYYPFNGNAKDESANGYDGEIVGPKLAEDRHGKSDNAFKFGGEFERIILGNIDLGDPITAYSYSFWMRHLVLPNGHAAYVINKHKPGTKHTTFAMYLYGKDDVPADSIGTLMHYGTTSGVWHSADSDDGNFKPKPGSWHHFTVTFNGTEVTFYADGQKHSSRTQPGNAAKNDSPVVLGGALSYSGFLEGYIDDVRIYNRALSADEIATLYDLEKPSGETAPDTKKSGALLWEFDAGGRIYSSPAIGPDGTVYAGGMGDGLAKIFALNGKTGAVKWQHSTEGNVFTSPTVTSDKTVYFGVNKILNAYDSQTGVKKWEFFMENYDITTNVAVGNDGNVYVGIQGSLYALDHKTGALQWRFQTAHDTIWADPSIGAYGTIYFGSFDNKFYALNPNGTKKWEFETQGNIETSASIGMEGTVYIGSKDKKVYALDGQTGIKKWEFLTGGQLGPSSVIGPDGTLFIGSGDKNIYALDGATGTKKWQFDSGPAGYAYSQPAIGADGTLFFGSQNKKLHALNSQTGKKIWEFMPAQTGDNHVTIGSDGTLYVGSYDHKLYAITSNCKGPAKSPWPMFGQNARHTGRVMK